MSAAHEALARVALNQVIEPGRPFWLARVVERGAIAVREELLSAGGSEESSVIAERLGTVDPAAVLDRARRLGLRWVVPGDDEWPGRLDDLHHVEPLHERSGVPLGLWVKGPLRLSSLDRSVAVVGARSATTYGTNVAGEIACTTARGGWSVVSGAAFGIDQAAHRGALAGDGATVAVLACGADRVYPKAHAPLIEHLAAHGAVVSEAAPGWAPTRIRFLARNRLIAALTRGTVVVEAAARSGALNTASWADRLSRPVMAVPGPVTSPLSQGAHQLVRRGGLLVTSGDDVLEQLGEAGDHLQQEVRGELRARDGLSDLHGRVLEAVPLAKAAGIESIARVGGLHPGEVADALQALEELGMVERTTHGWRLGEGGRA